MGKIKIVCFDEEEDVLNGIKKGTIHATIVQQPYEFGYQCITTMTQYLRGDKSVFPESKIKIVPTKIIKKDNVEEFQVKLKKLLD